MTSQTQLILTGFLLVSPLHFLGQGQAQGIVTLEEESKNPVWGKETRQEGNKSHSWPFRASKDGGKPTQV